MLTASRLLFILTLFSVSHGLAEKMDGSTHSLLIEKLERSLENLDKGDEASTAITKRIADLISERARLKEMDELGPKESLKCPVCPASREDRNRALSLYTSLLKKNDVQDKGEILIQIAHIHLLLNEQSKALKVFEDVIQAGSKEHPESLIGASHAGLGEIYYSKQNMKKAAYHLEEALKNSATRKKGFLTYRLAWTYLNQGRVTLATQKIESILRSPELLSAEVGDSLKVDTVFHEEVSRDYATFLAKGQVNRKQIDEYLALSPETARDSNLSYLANELDRTGKKKSALIVWQVINERKNVPGEKLEGHIRMAQVNYDMGQKSQTANDIKLAMEHWKLKGCKKEESCTDLQMKLKKLITDWDRATKSVKFKDPSVAPTPELAAAYESYLTVFDKDAEMAYWGASSLLRNHKYETASLMYRRATTLAKKEIKEAKTDAEKSKYQNIFEGSLLSEIESAEATKDPKARISSYENYLDQNPGGAKASEVKYQVAQTFYELADYNRAASVFRTVALDSRTPSELAIKSADLHLDCLHLMKDETLLEKQAIEYSQKFPTRQKEYLSLARKSALNQVAKAVNSPEASDSELRKSITRMNAVSLKGTSEKERATIYKDKMVIAERLKDLSTLISTADLLLGLKSLTKADKEFAQSRKLWAYEMGFEFHSAYKLAKQTGLLNLDAEDRPMKLAVLAELAGKNALPHYYDFLKISKKSAIKRQVMALIIRQASDFTKVLNQYELGLRDDKELLAELTLEEFGRTKDQRLATRRIKDGQLSRTRAGLALNRTVKLMNFENDHRALAAHRLSRSSSQLKSSLKTRLQLIKISETRAQSALDSRDHSLQLLHLNFMKNQYARLGREISDLPTPSGLNRSMRATYQKLLAEQAAPHFRSSERLNQTLEKLWAQSDLLDLLMKDFKNSKTSIRPLLALEIKRLAAIAPSSERKSLLETLTEGHPQARRSEILEARRELREDPFNIKRLERLKHLESEAGRYQVAGYLDARIRQIQSGGI
jgi:hypothetical protein